MPSKTRSAASPPPTATASTAPATPRKRTPRPAVAPAAPKPRTAQKSQTPQTPQTPQTAAPRKAKRSTAAAAPAKRVVPAKSPGAAAGASKPRKRPAAAPAARAAAEIPVAAQVVIEPPADGGVFGFHAVVVPGEETATVELRNAYPGTASCTCLDFALSEHADCAHVQALGAYLQADAQRAAAFARGPQAPGSRVALLHGARWRPLWLPGRECPAALEEAAERWLGVSPDALDEQALPQLLRAARAAGHELQVDEVVWAHLAAERDARARLLRLEALCAQGQPGTVLPELAQPDAPALLPLQWEAALFAVCAGRCILADAAALQPQRQALAAALLWQRHFGLQRVLVLAPQGALADWRRSLPADAAGWSLMDLARAADDAELHRALAPELVIVQEAAEGGLWIDPVQAAAVLRLPAAQAIVLPAPGWQERAPELPLRVAFVDEQRLGAYAALLDAHGERDESGDLCGLRDLDVLRTTLARVLLARTLDEVRAQLPECIESVRRVPMPEAVQAEHRALQQVLAQQLARWQRAGWLAAVEQRHLIEEVQALRRLCAGEGAPAVAQAKAEAIGALLGQHQTGVPKAVVFAQGPQALRMVQAALGEAGIASVLCHGGDGATQRQAGQRRFRDDADCRVLLVADGGGPLEPDLPAAQVVHLDRPWDAQVRARRFGRLHRRGTVQLVPVTQLLLQDSFEDAVERALGAPREQPVPELLDAGAQGGFVQDQALVQWLADLEAVLRLGGAWPGQAGASHS